jgi:hypothetical protein
MEHRRLPGDWPARQGQALLFRRWKHRRQTISEHQQRITEYLQYTPFGEAEAKRLEVFVFEESCRLEQTAALESRVQEFLKEQKILQPADSTVARIIGEQRKLAREHFFEKIAAAVPTELAKTLDDLLVVTGDKAVSRLQKIKANPNKASAEAMLSLTDRVCRKFCVRRHTSSSALTRASLYGSNTKFPTHSLGNILRSPQDSNRIVRLNYNFYRNDLFLQVNSCINALASCRSLVSNPSVNQP